MPTAIVPVRWSHARAEIGSLGVAVGVSSAPRMYLGRGSGGPTCVEGADKGAVGCVPYVDLTVTSGCGEVGASVLMTGLGLSDACHAFVYVLSLVEEADRRFVGFDI